MVKLIFLVVLVWTSSANAQSIFEAIRSIDAHAQLLVAERLPDDSWLVEVSVDGLRLPARLSDTNGFELVWSPSKEYVQALRGLVRSGELVQGVGEPWVAARRVPAFPIIVTRSRIITPFSSISLEDTEFREIPALQEDTRKWVFDVVKDDPHLARIDLILDRKVLWIQVMRVLLSVADTGYYRLGLVAASQGQLVVLEANSPVIMSVLDPSQMLRMAIFETEVGFGVRLAKEGREFEVNDCAELATFCAGSEQEFLSKIEAQVPDSQDRCVMGFGPEVSAQSVLNVVEWSRKWNTIRPVLSLVK